MSFHDTIDKVILKLTQLNSIMKQNKVQTQINIESIIEGYSSNEYKLQVESEIAEKNARELIESLNLEEKPKKSKKKGK